MSSFPGTGQLIHPKLQRGQHGVLTGRRAPHDQRNLRQAIVHRESVGSDPSVRRFSITSTATSVKSDSDLCQAQRLPSLEPVAAKFEPHPRSDDFPQRWKK